MSRQAPSGSFRGLGQPHAGRYLYPAFLLILLVAESRPALGSREIGRLSRGSKENGPALGSKENDADINCLPNRRGAFNWESAGGTSEEPCWGLGGHPGLVPAKGPGRGTVVAGSRELLRAPGARRSTIVAVPPERPSIPHILHQVFLDGKAQLLKEEAAGKKSGAIIPSFSARWRDSCRLHHPKWKHMFWDLEAAEKLLAERYPWFLPTFQAYPKVVLKGDALRPFLLHAYGGLYTDMDVECLQPVDDTLAGFEAVLQMEDEDGKSLNNAVMASAPGHPLWMTMAHLLEERQPHLLAVLAGEHSEEQAANAVLNGTGPWLLRDAFKRWSEEEGDLATSYAGPSSPQGHRMFIHPFGEWFIPCLWDDMECHIEVEKAGRAGALVQGVVGHHKNAGSWFSKAQEARAAAAKSSGAGPGVDQGVAGAAGLLAYTLPRAPRNALLWGSIVALLLLSLALMWQARRALQMSRKAGRPSFFTFLTHAASS